MKHSPRDPLIQALAAVSQIKSHQELTRSRSYLRTLLFRLRLRSRVGVCGPVLCADVVVIVSLTGAARAAAQRDQDPVHRIHGGFTTQSHQVGPHVARGEPGQQLVVKVLRQLELSTQRFQDPGRETEVPIQCLSSGSTKVRSSRETANVLSHTLLEGIRVLQWISHMLTLALLKLPCEKMQHQSSKHSGSLG